MLYELEVLEARHIADLAQDACSARDRVLKRIRATNVQEPRAARGAHTAGARAVFDAAMAALPEQVALRHAIASLPRDIQEKLWATALVGRGEGAISGWNESLRSAGQLSDEALAADLVDDPNLHDCLRKGLYVLGDATIPGDDR